MSSSSKAVDLRSDTVTRPSAQMRRAIAEAEVGDDVLGDDPTARALEVLAARTLGKERALFFPSGIMANQTAILIQSRPGVEVLVDADAHVLHYEEGAAAAWGGVHLRGIPSIDGILDLDALAANLRPASRYLPESTLLCLENTHNIAGGRIMPVDVLAKAAGLARSAGLSVHLDGARLPNASAAAGEPMREWAQHADTVMISLSKGLGAPIGSVLAGSEESIERAWRVRRRLGGAMRQVGILAAAGIYALENNMMRLNDDHERATRLAAEVGEIHGMTTNLPDTNIVMIDLDPSFGSAADIALELERYGVLVSTFGRYRLRAVTHLDVDDAGIETAIGALQEVSVRQLQM
jgi:threonine aldolase